MRLFNIKLFVISLGLIVSFSPYAFAKNIAVKDSNVVKSTVEKNIIEVEKNKNKLWIFIKGEKDKDEIMAGMWSQHFSSNRYREVHNLGGVQYKGFYIATFANSHSDQTVSIGIARTIAKKEIGKNLVFDASYKLGPMYGYKEGAPNIGGFTILPALCLNTTYRNVGFTVNLFPANAISFNTYIGLDMFRKKQNKL